MKTYRTHDWDEFRHWLPEVHERLTINFDLVKVEVTARELNGSENLVKFVWTELPEEVPA